MAQREKAAGLESATSEAAVPLKAAWIPARLWYLSHSFISHPVIGICRTLCWAQRGRNEVPTTFAHKSSLSSVWSGVGTWGALKVNATFRVCGRCPDNEKSRDWPWAGRGGRGTGQFGLQGHRTALGEEEGKQS